MASIKEDIQNIRALRKDIRDPTISITTLKAIEGIQQCIISGSDQNGWKKVEWRNTTAPRNTQPPKNNVFHNRQSNINGMRSESHAFGNRPRTTVPQKDITVESTVNDINKRGVINNTYQDNVDGFRQPVQKYVSKFKKTTGKVEDTILNTILLGKLNKFSEPNYNEIKEFITHIIDNGQTDMIKCFMNIVFEKAASEEIFCPLYARLLSELSIRYPVLLTEMENLFAEYMKIFEEIDSSSENYNELCKRNIEKKYRRGYSQFLAELIKHDCIDVSTFIKTITTIITQIELNQCILESIKLNEEFADCLMKIIKAIKTSLPHDTDTTKCITTIRKVFQQDMMERIKPFTIRSSDYMGMSNKARFTFLDIYENIQKF